MSAQEKWVFASTNSHTLFKINTCLLLKIKKTHKGKFTQQTYVADRKRGLIYCVHSHNTWLWPTEMKQLKNETTTTTTGAKFNGHCDTFHFSFCGLFFMHLENNKIMIPLLCSNYETKWMPIFLSKLVLSPSSCQSCFALFISVVSRRKSKGSFSHSTSYRHDSINVHFKHISLLSPFYWAQVYHDPHVWLDLLSFEHWAG